MIDPVSRCIEEGCEHQGEAGLEGYCVTCWKRARERPKFSKLAIAFVAVVVIIWLIKYFSH